MSTFVRDVPAYETVRDIDTIQFHRFFVDEKDFSIEEKDPLVSAFAGYEWIVSFLGEAETDFEKNLIFTIYSTQSAEISILPIFARRRKQRTHRRLLHQQIHTGKPVRTGRIQIQSAGNFDNPGKHGRAMGKAAARVGRDKPGRENSLIIQPGSGGKHKCWHLDNYCKIAADLADK